MPGAAPPPHFPFLCQAHGLSSESTEGEDTGRSVLGAVARSRAGRQKDLSYLRPLRRCRAASGGGAEERSPGGIAEKVPKENTGAPRGPQFMCVPSSLKQSLE